MRTRFRIAIAIAALVVTGIWAIARTRYHSDRPVVSTAGESSRKILLAAPPDSAAPIVSALETVRSARPQRGRASTGARENTRERLLASVALAPLAARMTMSAPEAIRPPAEGPLPVAAPAAAETAPATLSEAPKPTGLASLVPGWSAGGRGTAIIIRGGRGGIHDDCDLHRPGGGIAINSMAPSLRGGLGGIGGMGGMMGGGRSPGPFVPGRIRIR